MNSLLFSPLTARKRARVYEIITIIVAFVIAALLVYFAYYFSSLQADRYQYLREECAAGSEVACIELSRM